MLFGTLVIVSNNCCTIYIHKCCGLIGKNKNHFQAQLPVMTKYIKGGRTDRKADKCHAIVA